MHLQSTCCMSGTVTKVDVALSLGTDILVGRWVAERAWGGRMGSLWWCPVVKCSMTWPTSLIRNLNLCQLYAWNTMLL